MKLLLWLAVVAVCVMWLLRAGKSGPGAARRARDVDGGRDGEAMLQCAHCSVHFPASEAVGNAAGAVFCCEEHRSQHAAR